MASATYSHTVAILSADASYSPVDDVLDAIDLEQSSRYPGKQIHEIVDMWAASCDDNERTDLLSSIVMKCIHTEMDLHRNWQKDFKDADQRVQEEYEIKQELSSCDVSERFQKALIDAATHLRQILEDARQGRIKPVFVMDAKNWRSLPGPSAGLYSEYVSVAGSVAMSVMMLDAYSKQKS